MSNLAKIEHPENHLPADPMVSMIERMVTDPASDLDKLERMLAMKERMDAHSAMVAFSQALAEARSEIPPIIKDAEVDFTTQKGRTHYKHETLSGIAKVIDPILSKHGLSYRYRTSQQGGVMVTCIISHRLGHSEETTLAGAPDQSGNKNNFQAVGSAVTYLQRYTLKAALGLSAEVDDDAQGAAPQVQDHRENRDGVQQLPKSNAAQLSRQLMQAVQRAKTLTELKAIWTDERFKSDLATVRRFDPEQAAHVEAEKDTRKDALEQPADDLGGDKIPF
ncbi:ERF family protein [Oceaniglobus trochenteri]|uniref:ERF family protein n=1 Tax=Oceaniglobus trochenteri TaxID=2763260 RepID=UPI001CFF6EB5|nr:ERF family protein [Oceaniglobus trochenteri]